MSDRQSAGTYILEASEAEHARLIRLARGSAETVREMCARAVVTAGSRLIDVGCGPVGALLELAEIAGPRGTVVGIDSSAEAVDTARAIVAGQNLRNVEVIHGDVNTMDLSVVTADGPFDAAHVRLVLSHQADPAAMLRRVATLLRPAGKVLAFDFLAHPRYDPPVLASEQAWELMYAAARRRGAGPVGARLPQLCEEAGLRVLDARGSFDIRTPAREPLMGTRALLLSARTSIVRAALATEADVVALAASLTAAESQEFRSVVGALMVQVIAEVS
jgi:SAM-dependent methyltransferase